MAEVKPKQINKKCEHGIYKHLYKHCSNNICEHDTLRTQYVPCEGSSITIIINRFKVDEPIEQITVEYLFYSG
jgi:hypothetical protein